MKNLLEYLELIYKSKWLVIVPTLVFMALSIVIAMKLPNYYRSTTMILVEKQQIPESYVTPTDTTPFSQRLSTISQQILSRQNLENIINNFNLYKDEKSSPLLSLLSNLGIKVKVNYSKEDLLEKMVKDIDVRVIGDRRAGDAFSISYSGTSPETTMQVTNNLASLFIQENLKSREQYAEGTSEFLSNELENAKSTLEAQERAVRKFKEKYNGSLPEQLDANLRTLDRLTGELQNLTIQKKNAEDRKAQLEAQLSRNGVVAPGMPANPLVEEIEALQRDLATLRVNYKDTYPDVITTKKRIAELKEQLAKSRERDQKNQDTVEISYAERNPEAYSNLVSVKSQLEMIAHRETELKKQIRELETRVENTPASEQKFVDLRRDYDISLRNYQSLLEKKLQAKLAENLEKRQKGERFTIIDSANLPEKPYKPNKPAVAVTGTLMGMGLGLGIIFLMELKSPSFRKPEEIEETLHLKVLSTIPEFSSATQGHKGKR